MNFLLSLQSFDYDSNQFDYHVQRVTDGAHSNDGRISVNCFLKQAFISEALIVSLINDDEAQCERFFASVRERVEQALAHDNVPVLIDVEC